MPDDADEVFKRFIRALVPELASFGGALVQYVTQYSDRACEVRTPDGAMRFTVHVSLSPTPLWGLMPEHARELSAPSGESLLLLTAESAGFFLGPDALKRLVPQFSKVKKDNRVLINHNKVKAETRFSGPSELAEIVNGRLRARTA